MTLIVLADNCAFLNPPNGHDVFSHYLVDIHPSRLLLLFRLFIIGLGFVIVDMSIDSIKMFVLSIKWFFFSFSCSLRVSMGIMLVRVRGLGTMGQILYSIVRPHTSNACSIPSSIRKILFGWQLQSYIGYHCGNLILIDQFILFYYSKNSSEALMCKT